jgi:hypothetical protein
MKWKLRNFLTRLRKNWEMEAKEEVEVQALVKNRILNLEISILQIVL